MVKNKNNTNINFLKITSILFFSSYHKYTREETKEPNTSEDIKNDDNCEKII